MIEGQHCLRIPHQLHLCDKRRYEPTSIDNKEDFEIHPGADELRVDDALQGQMLLHVVAISIIDHSNDFLNRIWIILGHVCLITLINSFSDDSSDITFIFFFIVFNNL